MLLSVHVRNYKCFHGDVELSMIATREQRHGQRLARVGRRRVLPVAAIYGANASGKSTLVDAVEALRSLVLDVRAPRDRLRLTPHLGLGGQDPIDMGVEVLVEVDGVEEICSYEVSATQERILEERLVKVGRTRDVCVFERDASGTRLHDKELADNGEALARADFVDDNQTVLGALGPRFGGLIGAVWTWFSQQLHVIRPGAQYVQLPARISTDEVFADAMNRALGAADTGISRLEPVVVPLQRLGLHEDVLEDLMNMVRNNGGSIVTLAHGDEPGLLDMDESGNPRARLLMAHHEEGEVPFVLSLTEESDGTRRYMNLLPILFQLSGADTKGVFVIDELENSLHPHLTEAIVGDFLADTGEATRRQLVFTTHEVALMRSSLLRRDEMWLMDTCDGSSELHSVAEFADVGARKDADLYTMYMSGRLGGVPRV